jgi:A-macroglobulin receptor binding domain
LKNKDQYGVWYSTQATVDVLQTLVRRLGSSAAVDSVHAPMRIFVDGKPGPEFSISADSRQLTPQRADLTQFLPPGKHTIQIRSGDAESLRYSITYDHTVVAPSEAIRCTVHAERVGFRGYGMMLADVGLPPGAEVDRSSLEAVLASSWDVQSYEIQPDRIVVYLWPRAGGTTFSFSMKA